MKVPIAEGRAPWPVKLWRRLRHFRRARRSLEEVFTDYYRRNHWQDAESRSGPGSSLEQTAAVRAALPGLLEELGCSSILDVPCGDFHWMRELSEELEARQIGYLGGDIVEELVLENRRRHGGANRRFELLNLVDGELPRADLVLCRDCLVHLSYDQIFRALANVRASGAGYLLTTTFPRHRRNRDILTGSWHPLNLQAPPFRLPPPLTAIDERCTFPGYEDKTLALWRTRDLPEG